MKKVIKKLAILAIMATITTIIGIVLSITIDNLLINYCMNSLTVVYAIISILIFIRNIEIDKEENNYEKV
jgi:uncharacterized membrane protein YfcA